MNRSRFVAPLAAALILLGLLAAPEARAQNPDPLFARAVSAFLDDGGREPVLAAMADAEARLSPQCPRLDGFSVLSIDQISAVRTEPLSGRLLSGVWSMRMIAQRCGEAVVRNAVVLVDGERTRVVPMVPGMTAADTRLLAAVHPQVLVVVGALASDCDASPIVVDTAIATPADRHGAPSGAETWRERWMVRACDVLAPIDIAFSPDGSGGTDFDVTFARD